MREAEQYLRSRGADVDTEESTSPDDLTRRAAESSRAGYDRIIVCGGDGSLNLAVREYELGRTPMALLPLGSGDDFANVCGIPRSMKKACDVALDGRVREVDVATANGHRYMGVAGLGFDSEVNEYANQNGRFLSGSLVYLYAIFRVLAEIQAASRTHQHGKRHARGRDHVRRRGKFDGSTAAASASSPAAKIDDHLLDVCIVHRTSVGQLLTTLPRAYNGSHVKKPFVETGRGLEFRFESEEPLKVFGDGEHLTETPVKFGLAERKLPIVVP